MTPVSTEHTHAQALIDDLTEAYKVCTMTIAYCANARGEKADPHRLQVLFDCADLCLTTAAAAGRASKFLRPLAELTSDVAEACASAYADVEHGDLQLKKLYAVCLRAAQTCDEFTGKVEPAPVADEQDLALRGTFPASDPTPTSSQGSPSALANDPGAAG